MAISGLPAVGASVEISYNGFSFVGPYVESDIAAHPVYDNSGRIVKHVEYTLHVKAVITKDYTNGTEAGTTPGSITDTAAFRIRANDGDSSPPTVRDRLLQAGGKLVYNGQGVGQITVNSSNSDSDVNWGPKPQRCVMRKLGGSLVYEVDWVVTFCLPECRGVRNALGNLKAFSFSSSYSTDEGGFVTRTISGDLEIALNRTPAGANPPQRQPVALTEANVDEWLDTLAIDLPLRFQRVNTHRTISPDRSSLSFSVTDREHHSPNALPIGVVRADVSHSIRMSSSANSAFTRVDHHISGTIEVAGTYPAKHAWSRALLILKSRMRAIVSTGVWIPILVELSVTEQIFGRGVNFSVTFICNPKSSNPKNANDVAANSLEQDLGKSGLFQPIETTWEAWRDSLKEKAWSLRGRAGLRHNQQASGRLYSLCDGSTAASLSSSIVIQDKTEESRYSPGEQSAFGCDCPPASASLLQFKNEIKIAYASGAIQVVPLGQSTEGKLEYEAGEDSPQDTVTAGLAIRAAKNAVETVQSGAGTWAATLEGHSVCICHDPPIPKLYEVKTASGQVLRLTYVETDGEVIREDNYATMGDGIPVHRKRWKFKLIPVRTRALPNAGDIPDSSELTNSATKNIKNAGNFLGAAGKAIAEGFKPK